LWTAIAPEEIFLIKEMRFPHKIKENDWSEEHPQSYNFGKSSD
jgi:hypothetical protein